MWPPCRYLDPSVGSAAAAAASPTGGPPGCVMVTEAHLTTLNPGVGPAQLAAVRDHLLADSNLWGRSVLPFVRRAALLFVCLLAAAAIVAVGRGYVCALEAA